MFLCTPITSTVNAAAVVTCCANKTYMGTVRVDTATTYDSATVFAQRHDQGHSV